MSEWTVTLQPEQELALEEVVAQWALTQPETVWTPQLVLEAVVTEYLAGVLRGMDGRLEEIRRVVRRLTVPTRTAVLAELPARLKSRLEDLLNR